MGMVPTLIIMATGLVVGLWALWQDRKPYEPGNLPLVSPIVILYVCLVIEVLMAAHMVELITGTPLKGRFSSGF